MGVLSGPTEKDPRMGMPDTLGLPGIEPVSSLTWSCPSAVSTPLNWAKTESAG